MLASGQACQRRCSGRRKVPTGRSRLATSTWMPTGCGACGLLIARWAAARSASSQLRTMNAVKPAITSATTMSNTLFNRMGRSDQ